MLKDISEKAKSLLFIQMKNTLKFARKSFEKSLETALAIRNNQNNNFVKNIQFILLFKFLELWELNNTLPYRPDLDKNVTETLY